MCSCACIAIHLSSEKHNKILWLSRQHGRNSTAYPATPESDGRTAETDGGRAKADRGADCRFHWTDGPAGARATFPKGAVSGHSQFDSFDPKTELWDDY